MSTVTANASAGSCRPASDRRRRSRPRARSSPARGRPGWRSASAPPGSDPRALATQIGEDAGRHDDGERRDKRARQAGDIAADQRDDQDVRPGRGLRDGEEIGEAARSSSSRARRPTWRCISGRIGADRRRWRGRRAARDSTARIQSRPSPSLMAASTRHSAMLSGTRTASTTRSGQLREPDADEGGDREGERHERGRGREAAAPSSPPSTRIRPAAAAAMPLQHAVHRRRLAVAEIERAERRSR